MNNPTQAKIDVALSQYARGYRNNALIAELLFPRVEVLKQSDKYWKWGRENQQLTENDLRAAGSAAERIVRTQSTDAYGCYDHSLSDFIPDEERANYETGDLEQKSTQILTDKLLLALEKRVATLSTTLANYPAANRITLAGVTQWNDAASKPIDDIQTAHLQVLKTGKKANVLILGPEVAAKLKTNVQIKDRVAPTQTGPVTVENLAAIFEVEKVIVASAVELSLASAASFIWGKHAILAVVEDASSMQDQSFGKVFVWKSAPGTVAGFGTELGRVSPPSAKSDELAVHFYYNEKITSDISAYFVQNAVA